MKTVIPIIALIVIYSQPIYAQSNFQKGFVVAKGDTTHGLIDYRQWEKNPSSISFQSAAAPGNVVEFNTNDISYFEVNGADGYERAVVKKDMRPVHLKDLTENGDDLFEVDTVFLRLLVKGKMSLYQLTDGKNHFYISNDDNKFEELIYKVYLNKGVISRRPVYIDQLSRFVDRFKDKGNLLPLIQAANYKEADLIKVVTKLNSHIAGEVVYTAIKLKNPPSFFVGIGAAYSSLKFKGDDKAAGLDYNKSVKPLISAGIDMSILRNLQNLVFRAELSYFSMQFDGSGTVSNNSFTKRANYKLKVNTVSPGVSVLYNLLNSRKNKIYFGVGVAGNISSYPENIYSDVPESIGQPYEKSPYFSLEKFWLSTHAKAGWILNEKIELAATTKLDGAFSNFTASSVTASMSSLSINYHFH